MSKHFDNIIFNPGWDEEAFAPIYSNIPPDSIDATEMHPRIITATRIEAARRGGIVTDEFAEYAIDLLKNDDFLISI